MRIDILTLFPEMFESPLSYSILKRAQEQGIVGVAITNIRDFATDKYRKVDDKPYGGGPGMVMMPGPLFACFEHVETLAPHRGRVILLTPQGIPFTQAKARELAAEERLILIAGRYEGFDERILIGLGIEPPGSSSGGSCEARDGCVERESSHARPTLPPDETSSATAGPSPIRAEQISIGDYVLNGGELAAMVIVDAVVRLLPGALGDEASATDDSFSVGANNHSPLLEYAQYTRPEDFRGMKVPEILLSGDHAKIAQWRRQQALERTQAMAPRPAGSDAIWRRRNDLRGRSIMRGYSVTKGMTRVELFVVVIVLAFLAAVIWPSRTHLSPRMPMWLESLRHRQGHPRLLQRLPR